MRQANLAIIRERYPIPTVDELLQGMNGLVVFSKLDLKWGYHQLELTPESREITTFAIHNGVYRYKRLLFGVSSASEQYQHEIAAALAGIEGVENISDDVIVHARDQETHDKRLHTVMKRLEESGLTLNPDKCQFNMDRLVFMGILLSEKGIGPTEERVRAVSEAREPENASEVLQARALSLAHEGHLGIVGTKQHLRSKVWWPGMDKAAERHCHSILVVVDYYSRYYEYDVLTSTTTTKVIDSLESIFSRHGLPVTLRSDQGPQFKSEEFSNYCESNGIKHVKTTPRWAQASGEVERQNASLFKRIRIAESEGLDWKRELRKYVTVYRSIDHATTGKSPAELLFNRKMRGKLPDISTAQADLEVRDRDAAKRKVKDLR
ncbi:hypothetical protein AAFF_G00192760 [Aldrovandia affinis]|uniref:Gypsy retrotransposon integrase-like protein 1 n=1 Tax=Aldrovandia affinis TaxID=143900 RepID=A0AAD7RJ98_9TELE|nr:hypothetical protein AAFF_G00192760 [Aldrovandia affinis]